MTYVILYCLFGYPIFIWLQSAFINGVHISAAGETKTLPDGTKKHSEMILNRLYRYLTQKTIVPVYYTSFEEAKKIQDKVNHFGRGNQIVAMSVEGNHSICEGFGLKNGVEELRTVLGFIDQEIKISETTGISNVVMLYREVDVYRFSKYVRKPIIQCIICMASFWGFFTYWAPIYFIFGVNYFTIALWVANTFILSYVNFLIFKKN